MQSVDSVQVTINEGIEGDRYAGRSRKRQVTLIQHEHLVAIASLVHKQRIDPEVLRRNISVSGINLLALKGKRFRIGSVLLEYTGLCHPCSRMEEVLGKGGYNAVRGHGGSTAMVVESVSVSVSNWVAADV